MRPIITPFELELALQPDLAWTGKYVLDFETILAESADKNESKCDHALDCHSLLYGDYLGETAQTIENDVKEKEEEREGPMFSLTTGKYRYVKRYGVGKLHQNLSYE